MPKDKPDWKLKPAEDVSEAALQLFRDVRDEYHCDLDSFDIELWFWVEGPVTAGRVRLGRASLPNRREQIREGVDGIITLAWDWWLMASEDQRSWLLDHQLTHFDLKDPDDLSKGLRIVHHDVEEFVTVYKRHGAQLDEMQQLEAAVQLVLPATTSADEVEVTVHAAGEPPVSMTGDEFKERTKAMASG